MEIHSECRIKRRIRLGALPQPSDRLYTRLIVALWMAMLLAPMIGLEPNPELGDRAFAAVNEDDKVVSYDPTSVSDTLEAQK
jgi:hypothetical protein